MFEDSKARQLNRFCVLYSWDCATKSPTPSEAECEGNYRFLSQVSKHPRQAGCDHACYKNIYVQVYMELPNMNSYIEDKKITLC